MAEFNIKCPHCNTGLVAEKQWIGKAVECPSCKQIFTVTETSVPLYLNPEPSIVKYISTSIVKYISTDEYEDKFVLSFLQGLKGMNLGFAIVIPFLTILLYLRTDDPKYFLYGFLYFIGCLLDYFFMCYLRGIYRNIMYCKANQTNTKNEEK